MPIDWNPTGDFVAIVDASEPLTLIRHGASSATEIATAWRFRQRHAEAAATGGYVARADATWQFEWPAGSPLPRLGDVLRDATGECYTVLAVERAQGSTRLRCESRSLRIAHGLNCLVDIEQAVWQDLGSEPEITGWTHYRPAVHARIQADTLTVDETTEPVTSTATYKIYLEESVPLDHNHRFVAGDGAVYRLMSYSGAERIDELSVAMVRRE